MLEIKNVCKEYKSINGVVSALKDINITLKRGELVALVGKSGCGKSTLLNIIAGLLSPTSGELIYNECNICTLSKKELIDYRREHIGIILQNFSLLNDRTVYQNVELPLRIRKVDSKERKAKIDPLLESLGIKHKADSFPANLSGGEKQRTAFARALVCEPDILLADEPTGALDEGNAKQIIDLLKQVAMSGKIVIMATHDMSLVEQCDRCITISDGEII